MEALVMVMEEEGGLLSIIIERAEGGIVSSGAKDASVEGGLREATFLAGGGARTRTRD